MTKRKPTRFLVGVDTVTPRSTVKWPAVQVDIILDTTDAVDFIEHRYSPNTEYKSKSVNSYLRFLKSLDRVIESYQDSRSVAEVTKCVIDEISDRMKKLPLYDVGNRFMPTVEFRSQVVSAGAIFSGRFYLRDKHYIRYEGREFESIKRRVALKSELPYKTVTGKRVVVAQDCVFNEDSEWVDLDLQTGRMPHALWSFALHVYESPDEPFVVTAKEVAELLYSYNVARLWMSTEGNRGVCGAALVQISKGGLHPDIVKMYNQIFKLLTPIENLSKEQLEKLGLSLDVH